MVIATMGMPRAAARARGRPVVRRGRGVGLRAGATAGLHVFETAARAEGLAFTSFLEGLLHGLEVERMQPGFLGAVTLRSLASFAAEAAGEPEEPPFAYCNLSAFDGDEDHAGFFASKPDLDFAYEIAHAGQVRHHLVCAGAEDAAGGAGQCPLAALAADGTLGAGFLAPDDVVFLGALAGEPGEPGGGGGGAAAAEASSELAGHPTFKGAAVLRSSSPGRYREVLWANLGPEPPSDGLLDAWRAQRPGCLGAAYRLLYRFPAGQAVGISAALQDKQRADAAGGP